MSDAGDDEPAMAGAMRELVEIALHDGAVAAVLVWETADGRIGIAPAPDLASTRRGLLNIAMEMEGGG